MNNIVNNVAFLRTTREFPEELHQLCVEVNKAYLDTANNMNVRTIGIYPTNRSAITGNGYFLTPQKQNSFRQIYPFTAPGNIPHGINTAQISTFVIIYGTFTDGTKWYPLPYVDVTAANNQINVVVTSTNIVITAGGGSPPAISSGIVVLEWTSDV